MWQDIPIFKVSYEMLTWKKCFRCGKTFKYKQYIEWHNKCQHGRTATYVTTHLNIDIIEIGTRKVNMVELLYMCQVYIGKSIYYYQYIIQYPLYSLALNRPETTGRPGDIGSDEEF